MATASAIAESPIVLRQFTLRDVLVAVAISAGGFSIWRLPHGDWIDIPCTILSLLFVIGLTQRAVELIRLLRGSVERSPAQRTGTIAYTIGALTVAGALVFATILRFLAADGIAFRDPSKFIPYLSSFGPAKFVARDALPRNLQILLLIVALGLRPSRRQTNRAVPMRQKIYIAIALAGALLLAVRDGFERMYLPHLIYVALAGVELNQVPKLLPPELNVSTTVRKNHFISAAFGGLALLALNALLIGALASQWPHARRRTALVCLTLGGLAAQVYIAWWLTFPGVWQLSPEMREAIQLSYPIVVTMAAMILAGSIAHGWRTLVPWSPAPVGATSLRRVFFHETAFAAMCVGLASLACLIAETTDSLNALMQTLRVPSLTVDWEYLKTAFQDRPINFLWLAGAIAGLCAAIIRWRNGPQYDLPELGLARFVLVTAAIAISSLTAAPILGAFCFSLWPWAFQHRLV